MTPQDLFHGGGRVVAPVRLAGTHESQFRGTPATGRTVDAQMVAILRFADDGLVREQVRGTEAAPNRTGSRSAGLALEAIKREMVVRTPSSARGSGRSETSTRRSPRWEAGMRWPHSRSASEVRQSNEGR